MNGRKLCGVCCEKAKEYRNTHKDQINATKKRWEEKAREERRCLACGEPKDGDFWYCERCRTKEIIKNRVRRAAKRGEDEINYPRGENGICWMCNKEPVKEGGKTCEACYLKCLASLEKANAANAKTKKYHPWNRMQI